MEEKYETKKALATNSAKKRKVLLGTLIPLGCLVGATAIVVPVTLTYCKDNHFNLKIDPSSFQINQIKGGVPVDITNLKDQWKGVVAYDTAKKSETVADFYNASKNSNYMLEGISSGMISDGHPVIMQTPADWNENSSISPGKKTVYGFAMTLIQFQKWANYDIESSDKMPGDPIKLSFTIEN